MKRFHLLSWTGAAVVLAILAAGNYALSVFPFRLDTSAGRSYSISPASRELLGKLEDRLLVRVVFSRDLPPVYKLNERYVTDLLSEYRRASGGKVRVERLDPAASPKNRELAMDYGVVPVQLDVMERDRREVAEKFMGVSFTYGGRTEAIGFIQDVEGLEYEISLRIRKLIDPSRPVLALLSNGGALTADARSLDALAEPLRQIFDVRTGDANDPIPAEVSTVWWIGPTQASSPTVHANLNAFLARGGSVGLMIDSHDVNVSQFLARPVAHGLDGLLADWGLALNPGFIIDPQCDRIQIRAMQGSFQMVNVIDFAYFPLITSLDRSHPAARGIDAFTAPFCSPVEIRGAKPGLRYSPIARTSPASFLDPSPLVVSPLNQPEKDPQAPSGPFNVAVLVEGKFGGGEKTGRVMVFGTSRIVKSEYPARPSNYAMVLNFMDWMGQEESLVQIRSKGLQRRPLRDLPPAARSAIKYLMILFLPAATLAVGLVVWRRQRSRRRRVALEYGSGA